MSASKPSATTAPGPGVSRSLSAGGERYGEVWTVTLMPLPPLLLPNQWPPPKNPYQANSRMSTITTMAKMPPRWQMTPDRPGGAISTYSNRSPPLAPTIGREAPLELGREFRSGLGLGGWARTGCRREMPDLSTGDPVEGIGQLGGIGGARHQRRVGEEGKGVLGLVPGLQRDAR